MRLFYMYTHPPHTWSLLPHSHFPPIPTPTHPLYNAYHTTTHPRYRYRYLLYQHLIDTLITFPDPEQG